MVEQMKHKSLHGYVPPFNLAIVYLGMGERTLDDLEKACRAHSEWMSQLKMDRTFDPLRAEPRFIALMKCINDGCQGQEIRPAQSFYGPRRS